MRPFHVPFLLAGYILSPASTVRFLETKSFRQESPGESESLQEAKPRYLDSRNLRDSGFGGNRYEIIDEFKKQQQDEYAFQQSSYVDSSEIRDKPIGSDSSGPFSPMQFPTPLKYDESNAIRYPYSKSDNSLSQTASQSEPDTGVYESTLFRDDGRDGVERRVDFGNIDIGESTEASLGELSGEFHSGRDIEIYRNPGEYPYSGESIDIEMFDGIPSDVIYPAEESGENHPGSINFSLLSKSLKSAPPPVFQTPTPKNDEKIAFGFSTQSSRPDFVSKYVESDKLRNSQLEHDVNFGVMISAEDGTSENICSGTDREKLMDGLRTILTSEITENDEMNHKTGILMGLTIVDECNGYNQKESLANSFILLTNSPNSSHVRKMSEDDERILNVSRGHQLNEFTKALGKVGIRRYHTLTSEEVYSTDSLMAVLGRKDIDTVISDVHGKVLEILIERLSGLPEPASQYTWIFTSILSSDMLLRIEQLLSRTKVLSIFPVKNKKLLRATVKMKDNASQIFAMETSLPYLYMLRQLQQSYVAAWENLCQGKRGKCEKLSNLDPRRFIQTYFNPSITTRRKTPMSYMLIVYRSSSADDFLDVEIPEEKDWTTTTVKAVFSTVAKGTSKPRVVITETVSTINIDDWTSSSKTTESTSTLSTIEVIQNLTDASTTETFLVTSTTEATTAVSSTSMSSTSMPSTSMSSTSMSSTTETSTAVSKTSTMTSSSTTEMTDEIDELETCDEYNACILYLIEDLNDIGRAAWIKNILNRENEPIRRSGLSLGTALVSAGELLEKPLPRNLVATVTLDSFEDYIHPDIYNFNINEHVRDIPTEEVIVPVVSSLLADLVNEFGWNDIILVYFNTGITQMVANTLLRSRKTCVADIIHLQLNYLESPSFQRLVYEYSLLNTRVVIVSESPDQIVYLMESIAEEVGWESVASAEQLSWSYLQTAGSLAQLSEDLPNIRMYLLAESNTACEYCQDDPEEAITKGVRMLMHDVRQSLAEFSLQYCGPAKVPVMGCIQEFRGHLAMNKKDNLGFNILKLNPARLRDPDESLFILAGEYLEREMTLYEGHLALSMTDATDRVCINSTEDYHYQLLMKAQSGSNLESLWGSIALGISLFGILIVIISGFYFIFTVNRKQKTEYGSLKDHTRLLHYMLIFGLICLFCSPVPFLLRVGNITCSLRAALPGLAFSVVLSSLLVNLVATWRQNIYTVNPQAQQMSTCLCNPSSETPRGLLFAAVTLSFIQITITAIGIAVKPPSPQILDGQWRCDPGDSFEESMVLLHGWLLLLTLSTLGMAVACLKYCATNRDAKWSLVSVIALVTVWATWLALVRLLEFKYRDPVCVMALVVSALIVLLCLYARKLYEFTEFGKADNKLELMSNILLSDSPTNSQSGSRTYGTNILPGIIAMPEFEDNSILGDSIYQHINFEGREGGNGPVDMKMFEQEDYLQSDENDTHSGFDSMDDVDMESAHQLAQDQVYGREQMYHSISRGVSYKPMLKKIGTRKMLVLPNQHTLTHGSTSKI